jgi:hypothetical protein
VLGATMSAFGHSFDPSAIANLDEIEAYLQQIGD